MPLSGLAHRRAALIYLLSNGVLFLYESELWKELLLACVPPVISLLCSYALDNIQTKKIGKKAKKKIKNFFIFFYENEGNILSVFFVISMIEVIYVFGRKLVFHSLPQIPDWIKFLYIGCAAVVSIFSVIGVSLKEEEFKKKIRKRSKKDR